MALSNAQKDKILFLAEQLHEISQAAKQGRSFEDLSKNPPAATGLDGRSIEHIVTELTFLSTFLFAKGAALDAKQGGKIGDWRTKYFNGADSAEQVVRALGLNPGKLFTYKGLQRKCSVNLAILNTAANRQRSKELHDTDFMENADGAQEYAPGSCIVALKLLREMAEVLDADR
ncbi:MAG: hypothetical protein NTZ56_18515 [Acidobacteria bacterium]|nr:hypothetical protein [Acidobacteriota bacterium]